MGRQILELNYYPESSKFCEEYVIGSELDQDRTREMQEIITRGSYSLDVSQPSSLSLRAIGSSLS